MTKQKYLYWVEAEPVEEDYEFEKTLRRLRKWCTEYFGKPALKNPDRNSKLFYHRVRIDGWNPSQVYDHREARWMNKVSASPNQFWFKDDADAMAFMLMFSGEVKFSVKMNKNFVDCRKPKYPEPGLFSNLG